MKKHGSFQMSSAAVWVQFFNKLKTKQKKTKKTKKQKKLIKNKQKTTKKHALPKVKG